MSRLSNAFLALTALVFAACHGDDGPSLVVLSGAQVGTVAVELATGKVTVTGQPQALSLAGTAVYDDPADTVTLSLTIKNRSKTVLANVKALVTSVSDGAVTGDGTYAETGDAYVSFGPESIPKGKSVARDIVVTGVVGGGGTLTIDIDVRHAGWFLMSGDYDLIAGADSSGGGDFLGLDVEALGPFGDETELRPQAASPDGRYAYCAARNQAAVARVDLTNFAVEFSKSLMGGQIAHDGSGPPGTVDSLTPSPDGEFLYVVLNAGCHSTRFSGNYFPPDVTVLKLDSSSLSVKGQVVAFPTTATANAYRGRELSVNADGTRGALAVTGLGMVYLIDLTTMTLVDVDLGTAGVQGFDVSGHSLEPRYAAISPDGSEIYVTFASALAPDDGTLLVIDVASGITTTLAPPTLDGGGANFPGALRFGPDGRLYYGRQSVVGLSIYDPGGDAWSEDPTVVACGGVAFPPGRYCVYDLATGLVHSYDIATDVELAAPASGGFGVPVATAFGNHGLVLTAE